MRKRNSTDKMIGDARDHLWNVYNRVIGEAIRLEHECAEARARKHWGDMYLFGQQAAVRRAEAEAIKLALDRADKWNRI